MPKPRFLTREQVAELIQCGLVVSRPEEQCAVWYGRIFLFSAGQWHCWRRLWENFLKGNLPMPQGAVLSGWPGTTVQVSDLFKRHPAWKSVIVGDGNGRLWLATPE